MPDTDVHVYKKEARNDIIEHNENWINVHFSIVSNIF